MSESSGSYEPRLLDMDQPWTLFGYRCNPDYWGSWVEACDNLGWSAPSKEGWQICSGDPIFKTESEAREYAWSKGGRVRRRGSLTALSKEEWRDE